MKYELIPIYRTLLARFGRQKWWPAQGKGNAKKFEICIGAILTQNTAWKNVEKAIENLRQEGLLDSESLKKVSEKKIALLIKPAGYYNQKAKKVKAFVEFLHAVPLRRLERMPTEKARNLLLEVHGIGNETADSILLYALNKPVFVVDAYTKRIFERLLELKFKNYNEWQEFFHTNLLPNVALFNEYHALLVELGKNFCRKKPLCEKCLLAICGCKAR